MSDVKSTDLRLSDEDYMRRQSADLVSRLRASADGENDAMDAGLLFEAADEIARLRGIPLASKDETPLGYLHEITEPDWGDEPRRMYSASADNPWSHWTEKHKARCQYKCTPLYARSAHETSPPLPEYTTAIGEAGDLYLRSVALDGSHRLPGTFRWYELWDAMCKAARAAKP